MNSSDFRKQAREKLSNKWGKAALIALVYLAFYILLGVISDKFENTNLAAIISIIVLIIEIPIGFGLVCSFVKLFNGEDVKSYDFFSLGFNNFSKSWGIAINIFLKLLLPIILMIVSIVLLIIGIAGFAGGFSTLSNISTPVSNLFTLAFLLGFILLFISSLLMIFWSYYYQIAYIIAAENPDITPKEAVENSKKYMTGNRWKLFCLELSFIGWAFLCIFTLGIGMLWLAPYMQVATIAFSKYVCKKNEDTPITTENVQNNDNN